MAKPVGLQRRTDGFYLRRTVPKDLRSCIGKRELVVSLGTNDHRVAKQRHAEENARLEAYFAQLRSPDDGVPEAAVEAFLDRAALDYYNELTDVLKRELSTPGGDLRSLIESTRIEFEQCHFADGDYRVFQPRAQRYLEKERLALQPGAKSFFALCHRLHDAYLLALDDHHARLTGRRLVPNGADRPAWWGGSGSSLERLARTGDRSRACVGTRVDLRTLIDRFESEPKRRTNSPKTRVAKVLAFRALRECLGDDKPVSEISRDDMKAVRDLLLATPANAAQRYPGKSLAEAARLERGTKSPRLITTRTANNYLRWVTTLFAFAVQETYIPQSPAGGLALPLTSNGDRSPWTIQELNLLFSAPIFTGCVDDERNWSKAGPNRPRRGRFWVPLLCLLQGLRANEACLLFADDVYVENGVSLVRIAHNPERGQRLKTVSSASVLPLHPRLVAMGFADFASRQCATGGRLFPELTLDKDGYASHAFSKWFARFAESVGVTRRGAVLHSFRHNFRDAARRGGIPREKALALGRWQGSASVGDQYGQGFRPADLLEDIAKIDYPGLDLPS